MVCHIINKTIPTHLQTIEGIQRQTQDAIAKKIDITEASHAEQPKFTKQYATGKDSCLGTHLDHKDSI
jgi:hypothetical protein